MDDICNVLQCPLQRQAVCGITAHQGDCFPRISSRSRAFNKVQNRCVIQTEGLFPMVFLVICLCCLTHPQTELFNVNSNVHISVGSASRIQLTYGGSAVDAQMKANISPFFLIGETLVLVQIFTAKLPATLPADIGFLIILIDFEELAAKFELVAEVEASHERRYNKLLESYKAGKTFEGEAPLGWKCNNCGYIYIGEEAPEVCPVCAHPKAYFERKVENY